MRTEYETWKEIINGPLMEPLLFSSESEEDDIRNIINMVNDDFSQNINNTRDFGCLYSRFIHIKKETQNTEPEIFWEKWKSEFDFFYMKYNLYNGVMIANGDVERLFSRCKFYTHWKKNRITPENLRTRIICNENKDLLNDQ